MKKALLSMALLCFLASSQLGFAKNPTVQITTPVKVCKDPFCELEKRYLPAGKQVEVTSQWKDLYELKTFDGATVYIKREELKGKFRDPASIQKKKPKAFQNPFVVTEQNLIDLTQK